MRSIYLCATHNGGVLLSGRPTRAKNTASVTGTTSYANAQFNGSITGTIWKSAGDGIDRKYDFTYDNANRITAANFVQNTSGSTWDKGVIDFTTNNLSYDANGNILTMNQKGFKVTGPTLIDSLTYTYQTNSNKLSQVNDGVNDSLSKLGDFHYSGTKQATDYSYDGNGNLVMDNNKAIDNISYNYMNLPQLVHMNGKGNIQYVYDAAGRRMKKMITDSISRQVTSILYIGGFVYQQRDTITNPGGGNDTLQYILHEEGRARWAFHKYTNGNIAYGYEYDFFVKDHLGNTRVVLTQQRDTAKYIATMEAAYRATETQLFSNITTTSYPRTSVAGYPNDVSITNPNDSLARVNGNGQKVGPGLLLKVMHGDTLDIATQYYFSANGTLNSPNNSINDVLNSLATGLVNMTSGAKGSISDLNNTTTSPVYGALNSFLPSKDSNTTTRPKAYLNWILLDEQLHYVSSYPQSGAIPVTTAGFNNGQLQSPLTYTGLPITKSGYLYVWVSNETPGWDVFFDNLSVTHRSGPMLEENHYYPFGLSMAGISSKALKTNYVQNKNRYNSKEQQNQEFSDGTGLEEYDFGARFYDAQIGRWGAMDPLAEKYMGYSPYSYVINNPISVIDPTGAEIKVQNTGATLTGEDAQGFLRNIQEGLKDGDVIIRIDGGADIGDNGDNSRGGDDNGNSKGAWTVLHKWDDYYINKFRSEVSGIAARLKNVDLDYTCEDFALTCIATFAMENNLPFIFKTGARTFDATSSDYNNFDDFLHDLKKFSGARDLQNSYNTTSIGFDELQPGDLILLEHVSNGEAHHAQVITNIIYGGNESIRGIKIMQGNFYRILGTTQTINRNMCSQDPYQLGYCGTSLQSGYWDCQTDIFYNWTLNYSIQNYTSSGGNCLDFREWNFLDWNY